MNESPFISDKTTCSGDERKTMNIGILTFHASHNYGAMLQAYALKVIVEKLGHESHVIDYSPDSVRLRNQKIKWTRSPRQWAKNVLFSLHKLEWETRYNRYEQFKNEYFDLTEHFENAEELEQHPPQFDVYITGSDQVWNAERGINPIWLLDFVESGRKVAYAPSFGTGSVDQKNYEEFRKNLPLFDSLSCREQQGVELIKEMTGLDAEHVLDPTLLLSAEEWGKVSVAPSLKSPYLLVYCLEESPEFMELVPRVANRTKLPVVIIGGSAVNRFRCADRLVRNAGPAEFIGLFKNAAMICTNSFHGTAFSINLRKNFVSVPHTTRNSRLISLLNLVGLESRQVTHATEVDSWSTDDFQIKYASAEARLRTQVYASLDYLKKALV